MKKTRLMGSVIALSLAFSCTAGIPQMITCTSSSSVMTASASVVTPIRTEAYKVIRPCFMYACNSDKPHVLNADMLNPKYIVCRLPKGAIVKFSGISSQNYLLVKYGSKIGWVEKNNLIYAGSPVHIY